jgi:hypothetical protein
MTSIALSSKWYPESRSVSSSLRIDLFIDCSFKGYERQPLALRLRVPPTS